MSSLAERLEASARGGGRALDLCGLGLELWPEDALHGLAKLRSLVARKNRLAAVRGLARLQALESLDLSRNQLTSVPLARLVCLVSLDLSRNNLASLSADVVSLVKLVTLDVSRNKLTSLPDGFEALQELRTFNGSCNLFETLGDSFENMPLLDDLNVGDNPIDEEMLPPHTLLLVQKVWRLANNTSLLNVRLASAILEKSLHLEGGAAEADHQGSACAPHRHEQSPGRSL